ncbi:hypothetical protein [Weissella paramesenteroides]|jgi:hypothetical protein|uniref:hypothetical protein n=1 Tax=Weissella paramesenteroides TaxID=1249 RepID=UPI002E7C39AD|nr:hypothetical protein [Weissella paramesenteroides]WPQ68878.1 hypothetical protein QRX23_04570 [Weissella paramesenteroides]
MTDVRLMDTPEDYEKLGINPNHVEGWEDARRDYEGTGHWGWWYSDFLLDDGTSVVIQFFPKDPRDATYNKEKPTFQMLVTDKDGNTFKKAPNFAPETAYYGKEECDVSFDNGKNIFQGNLKDYHIVVDDNDGLGADFNLHSLSKPYRPGTAYFKFGDDFYTWLCVVPRGEVTGTLTINGKQEQIHGYGYHDHQWGGKRHFSELWNNWTWARQSYDDYSLLIFDMVTKGEFGYQRFPIAFVEDKDGNVIFQNKKDVDYTLVDKYKDEKSGKNYPSKQVFDFDDGEKHLHYELDAKEVLENQVAVTAYPKEVAQEMIAKGQNPSYTRYKGEGRMTISEEGKPNISRTNSLIFEFMYPGAVNFDEALKIK